MIDPTEREAQGIPLIDVELLTDAVMFAGEYVNVDEAREMAGGIAAEYTRLASETYREQQLRLRSEEEDAL